VEPLAADIARLNPALIVYDSFMVVAPLVGRRLGIPYVSMRAGHAQVPGPAIAAIAAEPSVAISAACLDAVRRLRDEHGLEDATPFAYLAGVSPHLNLYPEPSQYLDAGQAAAFAPIAFFGSLTLHRAAEAVPIFPGSGLKNVYVSFGTAVWRYYADSALGAMGVLADAAAASDVEMVISLGGYDAESTARHRIGRRHVRVETYVDQEAALREADIFVTHHGLNSTHEAAFQGVPMLSYPFFGDQPSMAACCQSLGFAMPLSSGLRQPLDLQGVVDRFQAVVAHRQELTARLRQAREWELDVMESRASVIDRMLALAD
ncbi:MAG: glycosyltransferase, partial [Vicinamibacterales bacterium]